MTATSGKDKTYYRGASKDAYFNRDTNDAADIVQEALAELKSGKAPKEVTKGLQTKGAAEIWACAVVNKANELNWKEIVAAANQDFAEGTHDSVSVQATVRLANSLMTDPNLENMKAKLKGYGASDPLLTHLTANRTIQKEQANLSWAYIVFGALFAGLGLWMTWPMFRGEPSSAYDSRGFIGVVLGLYSLGRGVIGLFRKSSVA